MIIWSEGDNCIPRAKVYVPHPGSNMEFEDNWQSFKVNDDWLHARTDKLGNFVEFYSEPTKRQAFRGGLQATIGGVLKRGLWSSRSSCVNALMPSIPMCSEVRFFTDIVDGKPQGISSGNATIAFLRTFEPGVLWLCWHDNDELKYEPLRYEARPVDEIYANRLEMLEDYKCIFCEESVKDVPFNDFRSAKDYAASAVCQPCQDM